MSIWASLPAPDDSDHELDCAIYVETEPGCFEFSGKPCSCGLPRAPLVWPEGHSNRYPDETLGRGGSVDIAHIPAHVKFRRDNPGAAVEDEPNSGWDPNYLRLGVNYATVILDRAGVELVYRTLGRWLDGEGQDSDLDETDGNLGSELVPAGADAGSIPATGPSVSSSSRTTVDLYAHLDTGDMRADILLLDDVTK